MLPSGHQDVRHSPSIASLFLSFLRLGATAFGGPAMVAYIRKMAVEQNRWLDAASFRDGVALCQTIPGATAMQVSAYVGFRARGMMGAFASFAGFGLPAFVIMVVLSALYVQTQALPTVVSAFNGLQAIIVAIVANAAVTFGRSSLKTWRSAAIAAIGAGMFALTVSPFLVILFAALLGLVLFQRQAVSSTMIAAEDKVRPPKALLVLGALVAVAFAVPFLVQPSLLDLSALMVRIDLFAFGGGFASVPLMFHEIVEVRSWMDGPTFLNGIALGQVTPGPIVITATFVGYLLYGIVGAVVATLSVFLPSFLMVVGVVPYCDRLRSSPVFNRVIVGVLASFVGLLVTVTARFAFDVPWDPLRLLLAGSAFVALLLKVDILWVVLAGTVLSVLFL